MRKISTFLTKYAMPIVFGVELVLVGVLLYYKVSLPALETQFFVSLRVWYCSCLIAGILALYVVKKQRPPRLTKQQQRKIKVARRVILLIAAIIAVWVVFIIADPSLGVR